MNEHYLAVLQDLRNRRVDLENQLKEVDSAIAAIEKLAGPTTRLVATTQAVQLPVTPRRVGAFASQANTRYATISVRWGVLWQLAEFSEGYQRTSDLAKALLDGGYRTDATNFVNMVSAVLSNMKQKGEVETNGEGGYQLTASGHEAWAHIRTSPRFRASTSPTEQSLLAVQ